MSRIAASEEFAEQVAPLRPGLLLHCYRMLGSSHDAEDAVQETLLRGWRGVDRFEGRSSLRTWLYTVATNVCLREIERRGRRLVPVDLGPAADPADGLAAPLTETVWLGPLPDAGITWESSPADAVYEQREAVELGVHRRAPAPPALQRAVLVLRDVLAFSAAETAEILDTTVAVGDERAGPGARARSAPRSPSAASRRCSARWVTARCGPRSRRSSRPGSGATSTRSSRCWPRTSRCPCRRTPSGTAAGPRSPRSSPRPRSARVGAGGWRRPRPTVSRRVAFMRLERADRGLPHPRPVGAHLRARRHHRRSPPSSTRRWCAHGVPRLGPWPCPTASRSAAACPRTPRRWPTCTSTSGTTPTPG